MKLLKDILFGVPLQSVSGSTDVQIKHIAFDSREVKKGTLFVAIKGTINDGHKHIYNAIKNGAVSVLCEDFPDELNTTITYVLCANTRHALAVVADRWYDSPSTQLKLVGITGTNGKTSVATMAYQLFQQMGYSTVPLLKQEICLALMILNVLFT